MIFERMEKIEIDIQNIEAEGLGFERIDSKISRQEKIKRIITESIKDLSETDRKRIRSEFEGFGPLEGLLTADGVTEIICNTGRDIWFEQNGRLLPLNDHFATKLTYRNFLNRLLDLSRMQITSEKPAAGGHFRNFRVQMIGADLTQTETAICLRRHPESPWTFEKLARAGWKHLDRLQLLLKEKKNFLVIGSTGVGKTSVLNACLKELAPEERVVIIEDSRELTLPNSASLRLLTRDDPQKILPPVDQGDLVRHALRLRPDRLVIGEIRGPEAKDLLMALSTGHSGSFSTLHASTAAQALIRLEMLIQLGAPHWNLQAIRRLIFMSLQAVVVLGRNGDGTRGLQGIFALSSLEETGFLLERMA